MRKNAMPVQFEEKTVKYKFWDEETDKYITGSTNELTWQLMKNRYVVLRDFLPKELRDMAMDMWRSCEEINLKFIDIEKKDIT